MQRLDLTWIAIGALGLGLGLGSAAVASTETVAPEPKLRAEKAEKSQKDAGEKPADAKKVGTAAAACVDPAKESAVNTLEALVVGRTETFGAALAEIGPAAVPAPAAPAPAPAAPAAR
jgi:hypothetical protein